MIDMEVVEVGHVCYIAVEFIVIMNPEVFVKDSLWYWTLIM